MSALGVSQVRGVGLGVWYVRGEGCWLSVLGVARRGPARTAVAELGCSVDRLFA